MSDRRSTATVFGLVVVTFAALAGVIAVVVAMAGQATSVFDLRAGDCFVLPISGADTELDAVDPVDCSEPHDAEVFSVGQLNPDQDRPYPSATEMFAELDERCAATPIPGTFGRLPIGPNESSWEPLGGRYLCVAVPFGGGTVTTSITTSINTT